MVKTSENREFSTFVFDEENKDKNELIMLDGTKCFRSRVSWSPPLRCRIPRGRPHPRGRSIVERLEVYIRQSFGHNAWSYADIFIRAVDNKSTPPAILPKRGAFKHKSRDRPPRALSPHSDHIRVCV